jgi:hypothetical protein
MEKNRHKSQAQSSKLKKSLKFEISDGGASGRVGQADGAHWDAEAGAFSGALNL